MFSLVISLSASAIGWSKPAGPTGSSNPVLNRAATALGPNHVGHDAREEPEESHDDPEGPTHEGVRGQERRCLLSPNDRIGPGVLEVHRRHPHLLNRPGNCRTSMIPRSKPETSGSRPEALPAQPADERSQTHFSTPLAHAYARPMNRITRNTIISTRAKTPSPA